jgi:hypothetical protein
MKYAVKMGSGSMIYIASFVNIGCGNQKLMGGGDLHTRTEHDGHKNLFLFFLIRKAG